MAAFLMNGWYCAAWSEELRVGAILPRTLLGMKVAIFRTSAGVPMALHDRCPHRFAPLSRGKVVGDTLECSYHGLAFDGSGKCVRSPFNETVPPQACVRTFPVVERHNAIWFWPGDPAKADPELIPDYSSIRNGDEPQGYLHLRANYQLAIDNLMDLSHIEFTHLRSFGGGGAFFSGTHETVRTGPSEIWSKWSMPNVDTPVPARPHLGIIKVDHWQNMRWNAPANLYFELGVRPVGQPANRAHSPPPQAHLLTPETEQTTHYFYSKPTGTSGTPADAVQRIAFEEEDGPTMEACQANMVTDFWSENPVVLKTDASAVMVRRALAKLIREEEDTKHRPAPTEISDLAAKATR